MMLRTLIWIGLLNLLTLATVSAADPISPGEAAPEFKVRRPDGSVVALDDFEETEVLVVCFTCNQCPVAQAYIDRFKAFVDKYEKTQVRFLAINCNHTDTEESIKAFINEHQLNYDYLADPSGQTARDFGASVTPQLFVLDEDRKVAFTGAFDDDLRQPSKSYVPDAVEALLQGNRPKVLTSRPFGCGIRFRR